MFVCQQSGLIIPVWDHRHCDQAIAEAVNTIIYAAPRTEVKELSMVRDQLIMKFGKEFAVAAMENQNDIVNSRVSFGRVSFFGFAFPWLRSLLIEHLFSIDCS